MFLVMILVRLYEFLCWSFLVDLCDLGLVFSSVEHVHYENMPSQIYWKFYHQKNENFEIKILIFFLFLLKT